MKSLHTLLICQFVYKPDDYTTPDNWHNHIPDKATAMYTYQAQNYIADYPTHDA